MLYLSTSNTNWVNRNEIFLLLSSHFPINILQFPAFSTQSLCSVILWIYFSWQTCIWLHQSFYIYIYLDLSSYIALWSELRYKYLNVCLRKWASETNSMKQECLIVQLGTQNYKGQVSKQPSICCWKSTLSRTIDCESLKIRDGTGFFVFVLFCLASSMFSAVPGTY